jgi:PAS domain S-box-containing protein
MSLAQSGARRPWGAGVQELDRLRRIGNTRALATGLAVVLAVAAVPFLMVGIDRRVVAVTVGASVAFTGCALLARARRGGDAAALLLNLLLVMVLFAGVAVNRQIGPGPAFVGFSLFVAAATLTLRGVVLGGLVGALTIVGMWYVARNEPQLAVPPSAALTYGLTLSFITTMLSVVQAINTRRALSQVVEREQRALTAEARAHESEARYRLITDNMSDLVGLLDHRGHVLYASPSIERILGYPPEELLARSSPDAIHPEDMPRAAADFAEALAHGKARGTYRCRDRDGRERWIEGVYDAVPGADGPLVAVAARDVTENRALASQLQQAQKMDALGRMAAAVAHDFNNLLTVIRAGVTLAEWELPGESTGRSALADAEQATGVAAALTQRLLAFARQDAVVAEVIDAREALSGLAELLPRAMGGLVELELRLGADLPLIVAAPVQLEQILLNLAINARDAMPEGGTLAVVARRRSLAEGEEPDCRPGDWLEIKAIDTGLGMSEAVMPHVFEPFFTTKAVGKGTGLGLSTCYGIVRQLGGQIRVASVVGEGTTFTILLPAAAARPEDAAGENAHHS